MINHRAIIQSKLNIRWSQLFSFLIFLFLIGQSIYGQEIDSAAYSIDKDEFFENLNKGWLPDSVNPNTSIITSNFYFKKRKEVIVDENILWKSLVIKNNNNTYLKGEIKFYSGSFVKPLGSRGISINLKPYSDTTIVIPFIIDVSKVEGGKTTTIQASFLPANLFLNRESQLEAVSFIKVEKNGGWLIKSKLDNPIWLSFENEKYIKLYISNNSNYSKRFKVNLKNSKSGNLTLDRFIELQRFKDTVIDISISKPLSNSLDENRFLVQVSHENVVKENRVYTNLYDNNYSANNRYGATPFNLEVGVFNFGGNGAPGFSLKTWGDINFTEDQRLRYSMLLYNLNNNSGAEDIWRFSRGDVSYSKGNSFISVGDQSLGGDFYREFGRGAQLKSDLLTGKDFNVGIGYVKSLFIDRSSYSSSGSFNLKGINIRPAFIYSIDKTNFVNKMEGSVSGSTSIKQHSISIGLSQSVRSNNYDSTTFQTASNTFLADTTLRGRGVRVAYSFNINRWRFSASSMSKSRYHAGSQNAVQQQKLNVFREIGENSSASLIFNRRKNIPSESFYGRLVNNNYLDISRTYLNYNYKVFSTNITSGVHYYYSELTNVLNPSTAAPSDMIFYASPRFFTRVSGKIEDISLTAFVESGATYFNLPEIKGGEEEGRLTQIGINVQDGNSIFSVRFSDGVFTPSILGLNALNISNSSNFNARYRANKKILQDKVQLDLSANYVNYTTAKVSLFTGNIGSQLNLSQGITISTFFNISTYSSSDQERISKSIFTNVGFRIRKEFNFDQPVLSYRDISFNLYFDQNGNSMRDSNEIVISDVLITIEGDKNNLQQIEGTSITENNGAAFFQDIPTGNYTIKINPIGNTNSGVSGTDFELNLSKDMVINVPLTEKYVLDGRVMLNKAKYSRINNFDYSLLRIKVIDPRDEVTFINIDNNGSFRRQLTKVEGLYKVELMTDQIPSFLIPENRVFYFDIDGFKSYQINFKLNEAKPAIFILDK